MKNSVIAAVESKYIRENKLYDVNVGDKIIVTYGLVNEIKAKSQRMTGIVIGISGDKYNRRFKLYRITKFNTMTRVFFYNSEVLQDIQLVVKHSVRRAKIYYIEGKKGKKARLKVKGRV